MPEDDRPPLTLSNPSSDAVDKHFERDVAEQLEVSYTVEKAQRRGSTLSLNHQRPQLARKRTSCFVHGLLKDDRLQQGDLPPLENVDEILTSGDKDPEGQSETLAQSRLLTKTEISEMTFSIRELSQRLGRYRLKFNVRNVFLLTKAHDESLISLTRDVAIWLLSAKSGGPHIVFVEDTFKNNEQFDAPGIAAMGSDYENRIKYWNNEMCATQPHLFDIVLALGGDGTVLYASWLFQRVVPPVLSFSLGSLGFLTKFDFNDYQTTLRDAFDNGMTVSLRLRLEATVMKSQCRGKPGQDLVHQLVGDEAEDQHTHKASETHDILNDLVTDRGPNPTMSAIEIFGNKFHVTTVQADGICISTPTGSTAYNLAAGGSLCHPDNPVILLTAICAHTLSFRPIIIPDTVVLRVGVPYDARTSSWVSFDGKARAELCPGDYVTISASRFPFPTVLPKGKGGEEWIESLSSTLNWNSRQKQKAFKEWGKA